MDQNRPVFKKFAAIGQLPSLPEVLLKLLQACNQDMPSIEEVSCIIETDPALSVRTLGLVNSAQYALQRRVDSMRQAVNLVGMNTIRNLALCASIHEVFPDSRNANDFDMKTFWWHSLLCGLLTRQLAEMSRCEKAEDAFLCGLFHDIGKLVLWKCFGDEYTRLVSRARNHESQLDLELRFGATHPEAGAWLLNHWGLPTIMSDGILYHHEPRSRITGALALVKEVYCAHEICLEVARSKEKKMDFQVAREVLGIPPENALTAFESAASKVEEVAGLLEIKVEAPPQIADEDCNAGSAQMNLAREVRDMGLLGGILEDLVTAEDQSQIILRLLEGIQILFDRNRVLIFLFNHDRNLLFCPCPPQEHLSSFSGTGTISLEQSRSLVVRCLLENRAIDSCSEKATVTSERPIMDDQIIDLLGGDGIYCVPIRAAGVGMGVLVFAMETSDQAFFKKRENLLSLFAQQAGLAFLAARSREKHFDSIHRERLDAVCTLERKISHEVRNPLSIIKNYIHVLGIKIADDEIARQEIQIIQEEIERVSNILEQLSAMSPESSSPAIGLTDINRVIGDLARIMEESLKVKSGVILNLELEENLPAVEVSRDDLKQVLGNLIQNAVETMKSGGNLTIMTRRLQDDGMDRNVNHGKTKTDVVEISLTDSGKGIPEFLLQRLFEPYVTTKKNDRSGLGLAIVRSLVTSFGGKVTCQNNPGGGSTFRVLLPVQGIDKKSCPLDLIVPISRLEK